MAETAGLVLGVVGVAGLIGAFKDTIDVFSLYSASKSLGRDSEILDIKLEIEKTLLLQWADRTNLLRPDSIDPRLRNQETQHAVVQALGCIRLFMEDVQGLQKRYGVKKYGSRQQHVGNKQSLWSSGSERYNKPEQCIHQAQADEADDGEPAAVVSVSRMASFAREFKALKLGIGLRQKKSSKKNRLRWVVRDKEAFEGIVRELEHFRTKLSELVPVDQQEGPALTDQDINTVNTTRELKLVFEATSGMFAASTQVAKIKGVQVLESLWFRTIHDRMNAVHSAHHDTFHWALQPPKEPGLWHDLEDWLRNGNGLYWISGKAGSGKSTLMKYLYHHRKTRELLLQWSQWRGEHPLLLADFFFWHLGTPDQKSQEGLSRALLYQVLVQNRRLIPEILPGMWTEADGTGGSVALPSPAETAQAFRVLASKSSEIQQDFCFFIDGLDEFVGSYTENVSFLKDMVKNHCFKIVISSRPIPECVSAFAELPSLSLQDLTYDDIKGYVQATVGRHKHMQGLLRRYRTEAMELLEDIVRKASGVFLWVILACRSVLHGFADSDRMSELQRRVNELPPELEVMFQHMLGTIDKRHRQQGARLIRMCYEHIQVTERDFNSNSALAMTTLGLALVDDDRFQAEDLSKLENSDKEDFCNDLRGRLRSRTGGLLEVKGQSLVDSNVVFMHRTVYEFLSDDRVWALDCLAVSDSSFHVSGALALLGFYQAMLRLLAVTRTIDNKFRDPDAGHWFRYGLQWAVHPESGGGGEGALFFTHLGHLIKKIINLDDSRVGGDVSDDILPWLKQARSFSLSIRCYHTLMLLATSWSLGLSPGNEEDELDLENEEMDSELDSSPVEIPNSVHEFFAVSKSKRKAEEEAERDLKRRCVHSDDVARVC